MADEFLKSCYRGMEADEAEMARYRARLALRLKKQNRFPLWIRAAGVVAAAAALIVWLAWPQRATFPDTDLIQVQNLAGRGAAVLERASILARDGKGLDRWNSIMILCVTEPTARAVMLAAQGIMEDPRPEFRAYYLEYLLDNADEYRYNRALLEEHMDQEEDSQCLLLYKQLFRVALLQDHFMMR